MTFRMQPSKLDGSAGLTPQSGPDLAVEAAELFPKGAVLTLNTTTTELEEHALGATVIDVHSVSLAGLESAGLVDDPSGLMVYARANLQTEFVAKVDNAGSVVTDIAASAIEIGLEFGLIKVGAGLDAEWRVDELDTTDVLCVITKIDDDLDIVWFKFLSSTLQVV